MRAGLLWVCAVFLLAPTLVLVAFSAHSYAATGQPARPHPPGTAYVVSSSRHDPPPNTCPGHQPGCQWHHPPGCHPPHCHRHHPPRCHPYHPHRRQPWCQCPGPVPGPGPRPTESPFPVPTVTVPSVPVPVASVPWVPLPTVAV